MSIVAMFFAFLCTAMMPSASADPYAAGYPDSGHRPDNKNHTFRFANAFPGDTFWHTVYGMGNLDDQASFADTYVESCSNVTDIVFVYTNDGGNGNRGSYRCALFNSIGECERSEIILNDAQLHNDYNWRKTSCHEVGHSGGLTHVGSGSCMVSGSVSADWWYKHYDQHHVWHLDNCGCVQ